MTGSQRGVVIDKGRCRRAGHCIEVCPRRLLAAGADGYPEPTAHLRRDCLKCGHCLAVCPHGAIVLDGVTAEQCPPLAPAAVLGREVADAFVRGRRSVREFRDEPVAFDTMEWLLDVVRWAPSAGNRQPVHLTVVDGRDKTRALAALVVEWMRGSRVGLYQDVVTAWDAGRDQVLRDAPHLVIAHASDQGFEPTVDCTIALTTLESAAHAVGVGACWAGFFMGAAKAHAPLVDALDLPSGHTARAALMLGMPRIHYQRVPPRRASRVRRI